MGEQSEARKRSGKIVRLSESVTNYIAKRRRKGESFDSCLRRQFGLPDRKNREQPLATYYVVPNGTAPVIRHSLADARGEAIILATKKKLGSRKAEAVIEVREVPLHG